MNKVLIEQIIEEHTFLARTFFSRSAEDIVKVAQRLARCLRGGGRILLAGNGGSAADAQHIAAELTCRFQRERPALAAIALNCDTCALTAIANDLGAKYIFSRQLEALARKGDVFVAITTSGESENILEALRSARERKIETVGLLGREGGAAREYVDFPLVVGAQKTARIQEIHSIIGHILCEAVEDELFGG